MGKLFGVEIGVFRHPSIKPTHDRRDIVDAILYIVKTGCQWNMLPNDYPNYKTVHDYFMNWSRDGIWEEALDTLNKIHRKKKIKKKHQAMES